MQIFREETFGPAVPVFKFDTEAEAVTMANDTEYGLAAYFFTKVLNGMNYILHLNLPDGIT